MIFYFMHPNFTLAILAEEILIKCMCSVVKKKRYKKYKIIHKKSLYKMIILNILKIPLLLLL